MTDWFASDAHLDDQRPDIATAFIDFLDRRVRGARRLFILGDLFESWVGDDDHDASKDAVTRALADLASSGTECFFVHGNRDFLVGESFARAAGVTLLPEEWVGEFNGRRALLMHGDTLCIDDVEYQAFRRTVRSPEWQRQFLGLPLERRYAMAREARDASRTGMANKPAAIMDVNEQAVLETMRRHEVTELIHGHTHRPAVHRYDDDGVSRTRRVLGDWYDSGRVIRWDANGPGEIALND